MNKCFSLGFSFGLPAVISQISHTPSKISLPIISLKKENKIEKKSFFLSSHTRHPLSTHDSLATHSHTPHKNTSLAHTHHYHSSLTNLSKNLSRLHSQRRLTLTLIFSEYSSLSLTLTSHKTLFLSLH